MRRADRLAEIVRPLRDAACTLLAGSWLQRGLRALLLVALVGSIALLVAWSGVLPIDARSGHWPVTRWLLHSTLRQTVELRSLGRQVPALDDPALIARGAGHYATGCMPCHGGPGVPPPVIPRQMTPAPPWLPAKLHEWSPAELYWIVKNGIKFTAMPAWPAAARDDEVWAMVAFLRQLPKLDEQAFRRWAFGATPASPGLDAAMTGRLAPLGQQLDAIVADCARCHGPDGNGRDAGAFPKLAGQKPAYLLASLQAFASGERASGIMQPIAAALDETTMQALASHYGGLPRSGAERIEPPIAASVQRTLQAHGRDGDAAGEPAPGEVIERGRLIASGEAAPLSGGGPRTPACQHCHGPQGQARNPVYPELAGQYPRYLALQLELFRSGVRGGTAYAHVMHHVAHALDDAQIEAVAAYYGALPAATAADRPR